MSGVRGNHGESIQSSGKTQLADFGDLIEKGSSSQMGKGFFGKYFSSSICTSTSVGFATSLLTAIFTLVLSSLTILNDSSLLCIVR